MPQSFSKDPQADLDYVIDWSDWLAGDTLNTSAWAVASGDVTLHDPAIVGDLTRVWVTGGTAGTIARITNSIVTTGGRDEDRTLTFIIQER